MKCEQDMTDHKSFPSDSFHNTVIFIIAMIHKLMYNSNHLILETLVSVRISKVIV